MLKISIEKTKKFFKYLAPFGLKKLKYKTLAINITSLCNSNCVYCEARFLDHNQGLSTERLKQLFREAKSLGVKEVFFSGGEPLLHRDIFDFINFCHELGLDISLASNGLLIDRLDEEQMNKLSLVNKIKISIDSPRAEVHNKLRGGDFFSRTISGIKKLVANKINVELSVVISKDNFRDLPQLISLAKELRVSYIGFQVIHANSNFSEVKAIDNKKYLLIDKAELNELEKRVFKTMRLAKKIKQKTNLPAIYPWIKKYFTFQENHIGDWPRDMVANFRCPEISTQIFIDYNGGLLPCAMLASRSNIKNKTLSEALLYLAELKKQIESGNFPAECQKCSCQATPNYVASVLGSPIKNFKGIINLIRNI